MDEWQVHAGPEGKPYYYNSKTGQSTWDKPEELKTPFDKALEATSWRQSIAPGGAKYWYNVENQQSLWDAPPEVVELLKRYPSNAFNGPPPPPVLGNVATMATSSPVNSGMQPSEFASQSPLSDTNAFQTLAYEQGKEKFIDLLSKFQVDEKWTWRDAMAKLIKDPLYFSVRDALTRKQIFEEYVEKTRIQREENLLKEREERLNAIGQALKNRKDIVYFTKWRTVKDKLLGPVFENVEERDCRLAFSRYVRELRDLHDNEENVKREAQMKVVHTFFDQLQVNVYTKWMDIREPLFKKVQVNKLTNIHRMDVLDAFQNLMKRLERDLNTERQKKKIVFYRQERKARKNFVNLLQSLREESKIRAGTKWTDIFPLIRDDDRFIAICGLPGSTPLELFWDIVEEEDRKFKLRKELILDTLASKRLKVNTNTSFEEFLSWIQVDSKQNNSDEDDYDNKLVESIFNNLISEVDRSGNPDVDTEFTNKGSNREYHNHHHQSSYQQQQDSSDDRHSRERRIRRAQDDLRYVMKHLDPPIDISDTWEMVEPRISNTTEYKALPDENTRKIAFEKHIRRLRERLHDKTESYGRRSDGYWRDRGHSQDRALQYDHEKEYREKHRDRYRDHDRYRNRDLDRDQERDRKRRKWDTERMHHASDRGNDVGPYLEY